MWNSLCGCGYSLKKGGFCPEMRDEMSFSRVFMIITAVGVVIGGLDKLVGNKLGLGDYFIGALKTVSQFAVSIMGLFIILPALATLISPYAAVISRTGLDPACISSIFPMDVGGYPFAVAVAQDADMGKFFGCIVCAMLGVGIIDLCIAKPLLQMQDEKFFMRGFLVGLISVPIGSVAGGLVAGFSPAAVLINTIPVLLISTLLAWGMWKIPQKMVQGCMVFSKALDFLPVVGLILGALSALLEVTLIPGMMSFYDSGKVLFNVALVLMGITPLLRILLKLLKRLFQKLSEKMGYSRDTVAALFIVTVNIFPMLDLYKDLDDRGKVLASAWAVPMVAAFGDLIAYGSSVAPTMLVPMIAGKLLGGIFCLLIAGFFMRDIPRKNEVAAAQLTADGM